MSVTAISVSALNDLLVGEIAAVETYVQALEKVEGWKQQDLQEAKEDHIDNCNYLRDVIRSQGGEPEHGSSTWGAWTKLVEGSAKMLGKSAAIQALKMGEELGLRLYQDSLENEELPEAFKETLRTRFIPQAERHIDMLNNAL